MLKKLRVLFLIIPMLVLAACDDEPVKNSETDENLPVISGVQDYNVHQNSTEPDFLEGVTAVDYEGNDITSSLVVDNTGLDLTTIDLYTISVSVTDSNGVTAKENFRVNVISSDISKVATFRDSFEWVGQKDDTKPTFRNYITGYYMHNLEIVEDVDMSVAGNYDVTYLFTNFYGVAHTVVKTYSVIDNTLPTLSSVTNTVNVTSIDLAGTIVDSDSTIVDETLRVELYKDELLIETIYLSDLLTSNTYSISFTDLYQNKDYVIKFYTDINSNGVLISDYLIASYDITTLEAGTLPGITQVTEETYDSISIDVSIDAIGDGIIVFEDIYLVIICECDDPVSDPISLIIGDNSTILFDNLYSGTTYYIEYYATYEIQYSEEGEVSGLIHKETVSTIGYSAPTAELEVVNQELDSITITLTLDDVDSTMTTVNTLFGIRLSLGSEIIATDWAYSLGEHTFTFDGLTDYTSYSLHVFATYDIKDINGEVTNSILGQYISTARIPDVNVDLDYTLIDGQLNFSLDIYNPYNTLIEDSVIIKLKTSCDEEISITNLDQTYSFDCDIEGSSSYTIYIIYKYYTRLDHSSTYYIQELDYYHSPLPGEGTESNPYQITNSDSFEWLAYYMDSYFQLQNDITVGYERISYSSYGEFNGTLDGNGYTVSDMYFYHSYFQDSTGLIYGTLFDVVGQNGVIKDITFDNVVVESGVDSVAGLVGINYGIIDNVNINATITTYEVYSRNNYEIEFAGVAHTNESTGVIKNSTFKGNITARMSAAGIALYNYGEVTNNSYIGDISAYAKASGIVLHNTGNVIGNSYEGDISGYLSYSISFDSFIFAGIIGYHYGESANISNNSSNGNIYYTEASSLPEVHKHIGGLIGRIENSANTEISNNYTIMDITMSGSRINVYEAVNEYVGGFIGSVISSESVSILNNYSKSVITAGYSSKITGYYGGFVGYIDSVVVSNNYTISSIDRASYWSGSVFYLGTFSGYSSATLSNNYSISDSTYLKSSLVDASDSSYNGIITQTDETFVTSDFITTTLGWSTDIWDLSDLTEGPKFN